MSITNMVYMPKPAWQEVGVKLPKLMTSSEAMAHAGLDYSVEKRALYTLGERNRLIPVEHSFATVRTDDSLTARHRRRSVHGSSKFFRV